LLKTHRAGTVTHKLTTLVHELREDEHTGQRAFATKPCTGHATQTEGVA